MVLTAILEVLDITIVNVAMPHMLGAFGATADQITWVLTSYIVAAAVVMPLTGYLSNWLGRRRLLLLSITGFILSSVRLRHGLESGEHRLLPPGPGRLRRAARALEPSHPARRLPREKHGQALAIFGLGIMVAPVIGPALGGYLTETYSWRMVFYINIPIGAVALLLSVGYLPQRAIKDIRTDWIGMALLVIAVGALQFVLDQGQMRDWFNSKVIVVGTIITVFTTAAFFLRGWNKPDNIIDLSLLRGPQFRRRHDCHHPLWHQPVRRDGAHAAVQPAAARLSGGRCRHLVHSRAASSAPSRSRSPAACSSGIVDARWLVGIGLVLTAVGTLLMAHLNLYVDYWSIASPNMVAGVGTGLFFVPLTAVAFASIASGKYDEASGVYSLMRGIGGSVGIAIVSSLFVRQAHIHFAELTGHITPFNQNLLPYLAEHGLTPLSPQAGPLIGNELARQAQMLAFNDMFWFIAIVTLAITPVLFFMTRPKKCRSCPAH